MSSAMRCRINCRVAQRLKPRSLAGEQMAAIFAVAANIKQFFDAIYKMPSLRRTNKASTRIKQRNLTLSKLIALL